MTLTATFAHGFYRSPTLLSKAKKAVCIQLLHETAASVVLSLLLSKQICSVGVVHVELVVRIVEGLTHELVHFRVVQTLTVLLGGTLVTVMADLRIDWTDHIRPIHVLISSSSPTSKFLFLMHLTLGDFGSLLGQRVVGLSSHLGLARA